MPDAVPGGGGVSSGGGNEPVPFDLCFRSCQPFDDANQCGDDEICVYLNYHSEGDDKASFFGMCVPSCDPLAPDCAQGEVCSSQGQYAQKTQWRCTPEDPQAGEEGSLCHGDDCGEALACVFDDALQTSVCRQVCDAGDLSVCAGRACQPSDLDVDVCALPPPDLGDACDPDGAACSGGDCLACGDQPGFCCIDAGALGQPCDNGSCNGDLGCINSQACGAFHECCLPVGGEGEACGENQACDAGLGCVHDPGACGQDMNECCKQVGGADQPCDNNQCDAGLACVHDMDACAVGSECCKPAGGADQPCDDNQCDAGLACIHDDAACAVGFACCKPAGGQDQPCADGQCDAGLSCIHDPEVCTIGFECCKPAGGEDQPCENGQCDAGLACVHDDQACAVGAECCKPAGGLGQPCEGNQCDGGLACVNSQSCGKAGECCVAAGGLDQPCSQHACNAGLACVHDNSCPSGQPECCKPGGGVGQPCLANNTCDQGLTCKPGPMPGDCSGDDPMCCLP